MVVGVDAKTKGLIAFHCLCVQSRSSRINCLHSEVSYLHVLMNSKWLDFSLC